VAQYSHHHHNLRHHHSQFRSTSKTWTHGKHERSSKQYSKREPIIISLLHAAGAAAMRQKFVQVAMVLHLLQQQRPVVAYEQQQELQQLYYDCHLTREMPRKQWTDDGGWEFAEVMTTVVSLLG
jgi:hypothetical protein